MKNIALKAKYRNIALETAKTMLNPSNTDTIVVGIIYEGRPWRLVYSWQELFPEDTIKKVLEKAAEVEREKSTELNEAIKDIVVEEEPLLSNKEIEAKVRARLGFKPRI